MKGVGRLFSEPVGGARTGAWIGLRPAHGGTPGGWFGRRWRGQGFARCSSPQDERVNASHRVGMAFRWKREGCVRGKRFCGGIGLRRCPWKRQRRTLIAVLDCRWRREHVCLILIVPEGPLYRLVFT